MCSLLHRDFTVTVYCDKTLSDDVLEETSIEIGHEKLNLLITPKQLNQQRVSRIINQIMENNFAEHLRQISINNWKKRKRIFVMH